MPQPEDILAGLSSITNSYQLIAVGWHIIIYSLLIILYRGWKPKINLFAALLSTPIFSVSILAWIYGNPFNGFVFGLLGVLMVIFGLKSSDAEISFSSSLYKMLGLLVILYGLVYPHFLSEPTIIKYLYAAPTGLIPCPTLSIVLGFTILMNNFSSKKWAVVLLPFGFFYALFGIVRLGVWLDVGLLLSTTVLLIMVIERRKQF